MCPLHGCVCLCGIHTHYLPLSLPFHPLLAAATLRQRHVTYVELSVVFNVLRVAQYFLPALSTLCSFCFFLFFFFLLHLWHNPKRKRNTHAHTHTRLAKPQETQEKERERERESIIEIVVSFAKCTTRCVLLDQLLRIRPAKLYPCYQPRAIKDNRALLAEEDC